MVCASTPPSPVNTQSAPVIADSRPTVSAITSTPGRVSASRNCSRAKPRPPAAPAPGVSTWVAPTTAENRASADSSRSTSAGPAPFCGPNTALAPPGPSSGAVTSHASLKRAAARRGSSPVRSTRSRRSSAAPPGGRGAPSASSSTAPSAVSMPAPASLVADPPRPMRNSAAPRSSAEVISWPTPNVLARNTSRSAVAMRSSPAAAAISMTASPRSAT